MSFLYIQQEKFELSQISFIAKQKLIEIETTDWQFFIWQFLADWFDETSDEITLHTSGSTSLPKTIRHKKAFMRASAAMTNAFLNIQARANAALVIPAQYIGGKMLLLRALLANMNIYCFQPKLSLQELLQSPEKFDLVSMTPAQLQENIASLIQFDAKIKNVIIGGASVPQHLAWQLSKLSCNFYESFGMTETISHIALKNLSRSESRFNCLSEITVAVDDKSCLKIYAENLGIDCLPTNDVVQIHSPKQFTWLGRSDFIINSGGVKLNPEFIENKIAHLFKKPILISWIEDEKFGQLPILISLQTEKNGLSEIAASHLLNKIEMPKKHFKVEALIYSKSGKINRIKCRELIENN